MSWTDPATPTGSDLETLPLPAVRTLAVRAHLIACGIDGVTNGWRMHEPRAVIFRNDTEPRPWTVYLPIAWPTIDGGSTHVCNTYEQALRLIRRAVELARLKDRLTA